MKAMKYLTLCAVLAAASTCLSASWKKELKTQLPLLGHRNWIVVADSAYPLQTAPGIKTVYADSAQLEVISPTCLRP